MKQETLKWDFDPFADRILKKYNVPGLSIGLEEDGERVYEKGFGFRDTEGELPLSSDTVFGIGSITKSFTAIGILQLQEEGKLSVNDPVTKYLPEFKTSDEKQTKQITIHHFLTHTAGLPPLPTLFGAVKRSMEQDPTFEDDQQQGDPLEGVQAIDTYEELMEAIATTEFTLLGAPGTVFSYSNEGYALLGAIIERVSGVIYEQYVKEHILDPVGMHHSGFHLEELKEHEDIAVLYDMRMKDNEEIVFRSNNHWDAPPMRAAGFLKSTVNDMLKYAEIIRNNGKAADMQILSPESVKSMTTPYIQNDYGTYYGYGLMIVPDFFGYKLIHHGGDVKGVTAQMNILPELDLTGIALANLAQVPSLKLLFAAFAGSIGKPIDASHLNLEEVDLAPEKLKEYEGTFISGEGMKNEFYVEDEKLHFITAQFPDTILKPFGKDLFWFNMREMDFVIRFVRNEENKIHRVVFGFRQIPKVEKS